MSRTTATAPKTSPEALATDRSGGGPKTPARERLLIAADELFYAEGVHTVGIDRVIEHAGVAKASLYNTFGSKDELVRAYLTRRRARMATRIDSAIARHRDPRRRLLAVFDAQSEWMIEPNFNGCAFNAASAESPDDGVAVELAREYRTWIRGVFAELARDAGARNPDALARQLHLLYDGVAQSGRIDRDPTAARIAKTAARTLLDAAIG